MANHFNFRKFRHFNRDKISIFPYYDTPTLDIISTQAALACSLKLLRRNYAGNCINVRRSSDNTTQDIGFNGTTLDIASLLSFCGAGNGFINTWYDQSGNANNLVQATQANQPKIVNAGAMLYENGEPYIDFDGTAYYLNVTSAINGSTFSCFSVYRKHTVSTYGLVLGTSVAGSLPYSTANDNTGTVYMGNRSGFYSIAYTSLNQKLYSGKMTSTTGVIYINGDNVGASYSALANANNFNYLGRRGANYSKAYGQEFILYTSYLSDDDMLKIHHATMTKYKIV